MHPDTIELLTEDVRAFVFLMTTITDRIRQRVIDYPQWSRAERCRLESIIEEVLTYCRSGVGNAFIADWCRRNLAGTDTSERNEVPQ